VPATLDDLLKIDGVSIAFEYAPDGTCVAYRGRTCLEMAAMVSVMRDGDHGVQDAVVSFTSLSEQN
jgi:roadblock/LC7 domain-containing protein